MSGSNVSHSNRHTKTRFKANVHKQTLLLNGKVRRVGLDQIAGSSGAARYPLEVVIPADGNLRAGQSATVFLP